MKHCIALFRPVARIHFGGCKTPKSGRFWPKKWTFWTSPLSTLLLKPNFWTILWLKVDLLADLGVSHSLATGLALLACNLWASCCKYLGRHCITVYFRSYRVQKRWRHKKTFFAFQRFGYHVSVFRWSTMKTSTAQIWWESVYGGLRYGRMNT